MPGLIYGLSREVTMSVLPRLNMEELLFELSRRVKNLDRENTIKDRLVGILRDVMLEEYHQLGRKSEGSFPSEVTITLPVQQEQETLTLQEIIPAAYAEAITCITSASDDTPSFSTQLLDTSSTTGTYSTATPLDGDENATPDQGAAPVLPDAETQADSRPFMCDKCGYRATNNGNLATHMKRHSVVKPFKCSNCKFKTAIKSDLVKHLKVHSGLRPHRCELCDYKTYRKSDVKKHMFVHTGAKPLKCERCEYRTAHKPALTVHMRRHTGEKPYCCQVCDFRTTDTGSLIRHMKNKHNEYNLARVREPYHK
ncbi:uncharacterized protein LOC144906975 [Branchiostoma floridae x Branchiostoma belcheri]